MCFFLRIILNNVQLLTCDPQENVFQVIMSHMTQFAVFHLEMCVEFHHFKGILMQFQMNFDSRIVLYDRKM